MAGFRGFTTSGRLRRKPAGSPKWNPFGNADFAFHQELVGAIPHGFDLAADGVNLIPNAIEQDVIQQARELHTGGMSLRNIAADLQRRSLNARNGHMFQATQIKRMVA